jgi:DNA-binding transcriptional ArsR family regulator
MVVKILSSPFGGQARTRVLVALRLLDSSFPRELSRILEVPVSAVSRALVGLERDALVVGRLVGRTRVYTGNPAYFAKRELDGFLLRLSDADAELRAHVARLRRRPRTTGKPL